LTISKVSKPGLYADGGGLYLQVTGLRGRSWIFRYMLHGKAKVMGLGSVTDVPLAKARELAQGCRQGLAAGIDPQEARESRKAQAALEAAKAMTFATCAAAYVEAHRAGWGRKHTQQWANTVSDYAYPVFGDLPIQKVDIGLVLKVLEPIWRDKTETAARVRSRIESVLDWASVRGYRTGENPARWKGRLENLLPRRGKVSKVKHHPALPYQQIGTFMTELRALDSVPARALEFTILTAARTGEVAGAVRSEFDAEFTIWTVPADRMKAGRDHRVPLSTPAREIVRDLLSIHGGEYVFPGARAGRSLGADTMRYLLGRIGHSLVTVHGFRATFRDWAAEQTAYPGEVVEMALAHTIRGAVEAAYRRGDLLEKRRQLMDAWATYCATIAQDGVVIPMRRAASE
jgi:integrase